jgi:NAD(P)-dependent dehydrogenase (short-subunit alcohol dehydrogenase family)
MAKTGRIAIINGAFQGIGRHTAELLAERGYAPNERVSKPCSATIPRILDGRRENDCTKFG